MKTLKIGKILFGVIVFALGSAGLSSVQAQNSGQATVGVTIRTSDKLVIRNTSDLDFGGVFLDKVNPTTVTMDKTGAVTSDNALLYDVDLQQMGGFSIVADAGFAFSLDFPTTLNLAKTGTPSETFVYTVAVYDAGGTQITPSSTNMSTIATGGTDLYKVAGSVLVPPTATVGIYTGNLTLTAIWN